MLLCWLLHFPGVHSRWVPREATMSKRCRPASAADPIKAGWSEAGRLWVLYHVGGWEGPLAIAFLRADVVCLSAAFISRAAVPMQYSTWPILCIAVLVLLPDALIPPTALTLPTDLLALLLFIALSLPKQPTPPVVLTAHVVFPTLALPIALL